MRKTSKHLPAPPRGGLTGQHHLNPQDTVRSNFGEYTA